MEGRFMTTPRYQTITGRTLDMSKLSADERRFLSAVQAKYETAPAWTEFAAWRISNFAESGLPADSVVYRLCQDLEARLGISQGKVAPPDYRDYLADLIDERYGSRYKFCRETGVDPGQLSRVLAGLSELSLPSLKRILEVLHAALVIEPDDSVAERLAPEQASRALAEVAG
jgi:transcriptional regulator with XRE-family HTH domain